MSSRWLLPLTVLVVAFVSGCTSTYLIRGEGGTPCAKVNEQVRGNAGYRNAYSAWLSGYLTRYNYERDTKLGQDYDRETLLMTAMQHCEKNPLDDFSHAAETLVKELEKR